MFETGILDMESCVLCQDFVETVDHLLFQCSFSKSVFNGVLHWIKLAPSRCEWRVWITRVTRGNTSLAKMRRRCLAAVIYHIWQERNLRVFQMQVSYSSSVVGDGALSNSIVAQIKCLVTCATPCKKRIICYVRCIAQCFICDAVANPPAPGPALYEMNERDAEESLGLNPYEACKLGCNLNSQINNLNMAIGKQGEALPANDAETCEELCEKEREL
ncbi:hypothetical protein Dimus_009459 [Dionaea muscipula]